MNDVHSLSHSKWNCKYHIVFAPKYRRKVFYAEKLNESKAAYVDNVAEIKENQAEILKLSREVYLKLCTL